MLDPATARRRLARMGLEAPIALLAVRQVTDEALRRALDDAPHLMLRRGDDRYVLGSPALGPAVAEIPGVAAGASRPFTPGEPMRVAQREAPGGLTPPTGIPWRIPVARPSRLGPRALRAFGARGFGIRDLRCLGVRVSVPRGWGGLRVPGSRGFGAQGAT